MQIIYIIKSTKNDTNVYKIGFTRRDINKRLNEFKTGNSNVMEIIYLFKSEKYMATIENMLHKHFESQRVDNSKEWFYLSDVDVDNLPLLYTKYYDMVDVLNKNTLNIKYK